MNTRLFLTAGLLVLVGWGCQKNSGSTKFIEAIGPTAIIAQDQVVTNGVVLIERAEFAQDVWLSIHADENGQPGRELARAGYSGHAFSNLRLTLEAGANSPRVHLIARADTNAMGVYEATTTDLPLRYNGIPVATTINVTYQGTSDMPPVGEPVVYQINTSTEGIELNLNAEL